MNNLKKTPHEILDEVKAGQEFSNKNVSIHWGSYASVKCIVLNDRDGCRKLNDTEALKIINAELR